MTSPPPSEPPAEPIPPAASWSSTALRIASAMAIAFLFAGYVAWLFGGDDFAKRIWMPFAWLIRHPPDPTLAALLGAILLTVLFFEPMYKFATKLKSVGGGLLEAEDHPVPPDNNPPAGKARTGQREP